METVDQSFVSLLYISDICVVVNVSCDIARARNACAVYAEMCAHAQMFHRVDVE